MSVPVSTALVLKKRRCSCCRQSRFLREFQGNHRTTVCRSCRRFGEDQQQLQKKIAMLKRRVKIARRQQSEAIDLEHRTMKLLDTALRALSWNRELHDKTKHPSIRSKPTPLQQAA